LKVFFDTNVWVSAFAAAGLCENLVSECLREHSVLSSPLVGEELFRTLDNKLKLDKPELKEIQELFRFASLIKDASASQGDTDARLLIAAAAAGADLFVSGDKAVLKRQSVGAMRIVSPRDAWLILFGPAATA
jgi:predicted nucleic acid-binding protein